MPFMMCLILFVLIAIALGQYSLQPHLIVACHDEAALIQVAYGSFEGFLTDVEGVAYVIGITLVAEATDSVVVVQVGEQLFGEVLGVLASGVLQGYVQFAIFPDVADICLQTVARVYGLKYLVAEYESIVAVVYYDFVAHVGRLPYEDICLVARLIGRVVGGEKFGDLGRCHDAVAVLVYVYVDDVSSSCLHALSLLAEGAEEVLH